MHARPVTRAACACIAAALLVLACAGSASARIVGGVRTSITQVPWQVDVWSEGSLGVIDCGGSILDASTVLTAAHCVEDTTPGASPRKGGLAVWAGTSSISSKTASAADRLNLQERRVASVRVHPAWRKKVSTTGDLAILTLAEPLDLDGPTAAAIALPQPQLVPEGEVFPVAAQLTVSGYGITSGSGGTDGRLRSVAVTPVDPDLCDDADNAISICAEGRSGSACSGDSGGPVFAPGPVLVGVVSNGPRNCPVGGANRYVNLAVPENLAFLTTAGVPPAAPRRARDARFVGRTDQLDVGQSLTCDGGGFSGATVARTAITTPDGVTLLVATGPSATIQLTPDLVGLRLRCRGYGSNAGGVSVSRIATTLGAVGATAAAGTCEGTAPVLAAVHARAPSRARRGQRITVAVTATPRSGHGHAVLVVVKRAATGATPIRSVRTIRAGAPTATVRVSVTVPKGLPVGRRQVFQVVAATFATRAEAERAQGLTGACDSGEGTFRLLVAR
ncbi:MAG: serine protease [Patulibacter minatonensis]